MAVKIYTEGHAEVREEICPEGWVEIDVYHPSSTVTPWDYYGMKHQREFGRVLEDAGVEHVKLVTHRKHLTPTGTGPGGSVRFGDNMLPGVYRIAVRQGQEAAANIAFARHKQAVQDWLDHKSPMPAACR